METEPFAQLCQSALDLAAQNTWSQIALGAICRASDISLSDCVRLGITKRDVAAALDKTLDQAMLEGAGNLETSESVRDRLFEVIMARFDEMETNRAAWVSILSADARSPSAQLARIGRRTHTATWALEAAGVSSDGIEGAARVAGLTRILRKAEAVWCTDSGDLSRTMAHLDQSLRTAEERVLRLQSISDRMFRRTATKDEFNPDAPPAGEPSL